MSETAPGPVLRFLHQSAFYGVAVYVAQLFDALALTPDIEVVVTLLPERFLGAQGKTIFDPDFDIDDSGLPHEKPRHPK